MSLKICLCNRFIFLSMTMRDPCPFLRGNPCPFLNLCPFPNPSLSSRSFAISIRCEISHSQSEVIKSGKIGDELSARGYALCATRYALHVTHYVLRTTRYALPGATDKGRPGRPRMPLGVGEGILSALNDSGYKKIKFSSRC